MPSIEQILQRRGDLSTFLVHFTRSGPSGSAFDNLVSILSNRNLEARTAFGLASNRQGQLAGTAYDQASVCFSEVPLEYAWTLTQQIDGRAVILEPFGFAIAKGFGRDHGANPVWYSDQSEGNRDWLAMRVNILVEEAIAALPGALTDPTGPDARTCEVLHLTPFFEPFGKYKDFYWEREWRVNGSLTIRPRRVVCAFAPEAVHEQLRSALDVQDDWSTRNLPILDPWWSLERMVLTISGVVED